jgi:hypothetical protein
MSADRQGRRDESSYTTIPSMQLLVIRAPSRKSAVRLFGNLLNETAVPRIRANVRRSPGAADRPARPAQITHTKARRARIVLFSAFALSDTGRRPMSESTAMDLRLPLGLLFLVLGVILADFGVLMPGVARRASSRRPPRGA